MNNIWGKGRREKSFTWENSCLAFCFKYFFKGQLLLKDLKGWVGGSRYPSKTEYIIRQWSSATTLCMESLTNYKVSNHHTSPASFLHFPFMLHIAKSIFAIIFANNNNNIANDICKYLQKIIILKKKLYAMCLLPKLPCLSRERHLSLPQRYNRKNVKWGKIANKYLCPTFLASSVQQRYYLITPEDKDCTDAFFHVQQHVPRSWFWP